MDLNREYYFVTIFRWEWESISTKDRSLFQTILVATMKHFDFILWNIYDTLLINEHEQDRKISHK